ncbi:MAG: methionyl-tRNA formyltransferase [Saprospiraceae bacterium]|jgi:methionyl-tRNA formyltransferase
MRIVFLGTPDFAVATLDALIKASYNVVGVITAPDRLGGRGRKQVIESAVKKFAVKSNIPVLQPTNLKSPAFQNELRSWKADIQVVVAFRMLPVTVWDMPPLGTYNLHGSLLPAYRGAAPINWAVIRGEEYTGVTTFKLKHEIDTGSIALQAKVAIEKSDNVGDVHDKMMLAGAQLMVRTLQALESDSLKLLEQDDTKVSKAPKIFHEDCEIKTNETPLNIYNLIRGLSPYPLSWIHILDKKIKVISASYTFDKHTYTLGSVVSDGKSYLGIACDGGWIFLEKIKPEGKGIMRIRDFLNGQQLKSSTSIFELQSVILG